MTSVESKDIEALREQINHWKEESSNSKKKCKKFKKKVKKAKKKIKNAFWMSDHKKKKLEQKIHSCKAKSIKEKQFIKELEEKVRNLEFSMKLEEERQKCKEQTNELEKRMIAMEVSDRDYRLLTGMILKEVLPGMCIKHGRAHVNQGPEIINQDLF